MKSKKILLLIVTISIFYFHSCTDRADNLIDSSGNTIPTTAIKLSVETPGNGEILRPGSSYQIKWSFPSSIKKVLIQLFRKREFKLVIANAFENSGQFFWNIPKDMLNSIHYRIKICDYDSPEFEATSDYFAVFNQ